MTTVITPSHIPVKYVAPIAFAKPHESPSPLSQSEEILHLLKEKCRSTDQLRLNGFYAVILKIINIFQRCLKIQSNIAEKLAIHRQASEQHRIFKKFIKKIPLEPLNFTPTETSWVLTTLRNDLGTEEIRNLYKACKYLKCKHLLNNLKVALEKGQTDLFMKTFKMLPESLQKIFYSLASKKHNKTNHSHFGRKELKNNPGIFLTLADEYGKCVIDQFKDLFVGLAIASKDVAILSTFAEEFGKNPGAAHELPKALSENSRRMFRIGPSAAAAPLDAHAIAQAKDQIDRHEIQHVTQSIKTMFKQPLHSIEAYDVSVERMLRDLSDDLIDAPVTVAMVGVEYASFIKQGGLAEALEGMTKSLLKVNPKNKARLIFPFYNILPKEILFNLTPSKQVFKDKNNQTIPVLYGVFEGVECFFIQDDSFTLDAKDPNIYGPNEEACKKRFYTFSNLASEVLLQMKGNDVIHLHDWHVAGIAIKLAKEHRKEWEDGEIPPVVFTFHNNNRSSQGRNYAGIYNYTPAVKALIDNGIAETNSNIFVEVLDIADAVTTVSETFALEAQLPQLGEGISFAVRAAAKTGKLAGIINGIDTNRWNPATDLALTLWKDPETQKPVNLTLSLILANAFIKKKDAKQQFQKWLKLHAPDGRISKKTSSKNLKPATDINAVFDPNKPVVTFLGRFDSLQKGMEKLDEAIDATLSSGGQFVIMGSQEDEAASKLLDALEKKYPQGLVVIRDFKNELGKFHYQQGNPAKELPGIGSVVRAMTDFTFIPSKFEPCGLVQFEAWLFGSLAIGSNTGGLADTIITETASPDEYNGYLFNRNSTGEDGVRATIERAIEKWHDAPVSDKDALVKRLMANGKRYGWNSAPKGMPPANKYRIVYQKAIQRIKARKQPNTAQKFNLHHLLHKQPVAHSAALADYQNEFVKKEEEYLKEYYYGSLNDKGLEKLYLGLPPEIRSQLPTPYHRANFELYKELGAIYSDAGVKFAVHAPKAKSVNVVLYNASLNTHRVHPLVKTSDGRWKLTVPHLKPGQRYQYMVNDQLKIDPYGTSHVTEPSSPTVPYSVVNDPTAFTWNDASWVEQRRKLAGKSIPMSIFEVHPTTWSRTEKGGVLNYKELAHKLVEHCVNTGFTHVELMGILEHPAEISMGYQVTGFFAPNSRLGTMDDFKYLINYLHENKIGVVLDWIPAHFAVDAYGLAKFDGSSLFEAKLWDKMVSNRKFYGWGTHFFDFSKESVREFLLSSALYWIREMHIDALRVDAVRNILDCEHPNQARLFLKELNTLVHTKCKGALTIAEDYSGNPIVTKPHFDEGLGFDMRWNIGWMKSMLSYFTTSPFKRKDKYHALVQSLYCNFDSKNVLALSHDEVKKGKKTLFEKVSGLDEDNRFANLRLMLSFEMCTPGKKLHFMGNEIASSTEWEEYMGNAPHPGMLEAEQNAKSEPVLAMLRRLHHLYKTETALSEKDDNGQDIEWIVKNDPDQRLVAYRRVGKDYKIACFHNVAGAESIKYIVPFEKPDMDPKLIFTSDEKLFGGSSNKNVNVELIAEGGQVVAYEVIIPPLTTIMVRETPCPYVFDKPQIAPKHTSSIASAGASNKESTASKIKRIIIKIFKAIAKFFAYPFRYFGAKRWSLPGIIGRFFKKAFCCKRIQRSDILGPKPPPKKELSSDDVKPYIKYACIAASIHTGKEDWTQPLGIQIVSPKKIAHKLQGIPDGLEARNSCFYDSGTGLKIGIFQKDTKTIISFGARGSSDSEEPSPELQKKMRQKLTDTATRNIIGARSAIYKQAEAFVASLRNHPDFKDKEIELCGQCFGGSIASYVALRQELKSVCLNSLPLGPGLQEKIGPKKLAQADQFVTLISVKGDYVSDQRGVLRAIDKIAGFIGIKTAGNFGKRNLVPSAYTSKRDIHYFILGSMLELCGYGKLAKGPALATLASY